MKHPKLQVWSCGGGTQSCAIGALIVQGRLPKPDVCVIADTGRERQNTWDYLDNTLRPNLAKVGVAIARVTATEYGYYSNELFINNKLTIPYINQEYNPPMRASAFCSGNWKRDAIENFIRKSLGWKRSEYCLWIGFSRDEGRRITKMQSGKDYPEGLISFPLLDARMTRRECVKLVESMGWPTPPRSACWMCPNNSDYEWRDIIKNRPDEFKKAVELEREIHLIDPDAWLHRSCVPLDQVDFSQPEDLFSRPCDSGMCFV